LLTGCGKNPASQKLTVAGEHSADENKSVPADFITYSNPTYGFQLSYPQEMNSETDLAEGMLVLTFPEAMTTSTNLSRAEVWVSANRQDCDAFGGSEDLVVAWHYAKMLSTSSAFPQALEVNGVEFKRLKCSGAAMSHVADTLSYIGDVSGKQIAITLFLYSSNPEVYSDELRPRKYDPAPIEKMYLQILNSFKIMKTYE
jgi:hypothetical protein